MHYLCEKYKLMSINLMLALIAVVAIAAAAVIYSKSQAQLGELKNRYEGQVGELNDKLAEALRTAAEAEKQSALASQRLQSEHDEAERRMAELRSQAQANLDQERQHSQELREELEKKQDEKQKLMREEFRNMAEQMLGDSKAALTTENKRRLEELLDPLRERIDNFNRTVNDNTKENLANKAELKTVFEDAMKKLHDEQQMTVRAMRDDQERTVKALKEQTDRIGNDAASLTEALKGNSKVQGDWGEMILEKTLDDCGLAKGQQYFLQQNFQDSDGKNYRPDAIVLFPNNERVVIDSKVSLTAFHAAVKSSDTEERNQLLKDHVKSVKMHVDELAKANYDKVVPGCIGYVLMFIPYESGYSAALHTDPTLLNYAYRKHIILLSPANLLMALQLTHTMWQNYRINANVEEILRQSNDLYDKFCTFAETFVHLEVDIRKMQTDYDKAMGQLRDGKGNIIRRLTGMKELGITPKKEIPEGI